MRLDIAYSSLGSSQNALNFGHHLRNFRLKLPGNYEKPNEHASLNQQCERRHDYKHRQNSEKSLVHVGVQALGMTNLA
jgi:hypothetical protein